MAKFQDIKQIAGQFCFIVSDSERTYNSLCTFDSTTYTGNISSTFGKLYRVTLKSL